MLKINETPVRTSRNFNINNIKLGNVDLPKTIGKFSNVQITGEESNNKIDIFDSNDNNIFNDKLVYGISEKLEEQVRKSANKRVYLEIDSDIDEEADRIISFKFDKENLNLVDDIKIVAKENTKSTVIIKYESDENILCYHNGIISVETNENAKLDIIIVNLINNQSQNFLAIQNKLDKNSKIKYTIVDFGGKNSITNLYSNLVGDHSENYLNTIYLGKDEELLDLNYITELKGIKSNVNIEVQGALKDTARKHFKGTIDFKKGCKKAKGNENESCMLLSDKAKSLALPMLLCSEEDVEGNHSTSSGKAGNKELFYIMSRGLSYKDAMKLLVRAKFNSIIDNIKDEELKNKILIEIDKRLD